jgi:2-polyprenyl-3-methyl-5-hydroxy-6-metoxy-1,4-benzoquinol methylase
MKSTDVKDIYSSDYFLKSVDGFEDFDVFDGRFSSLFFRYQRNVTLLGLAPEHSFLDIGCGRGEICMYHSLSGGKSAGIDFSGDAIQLAIKKAKSLQVQVDFKEDSFEYMSQLPNTFDRILASEFIEHISKDEAKRFFELAYFSLKTGGQLLVFTTPNTLQRKYGYPIVRFFSMLVGKNLPKQQPDTLSDHYKLFHLNEQNVFDLSNSAREAGFTSIEVGYDNPHHELKIWPIRILIKILGLIPIKHLFLTNLYLKVKK